MRYDRVVPRVLVLGLALLGCASPRELADSGIRTTCGSLTHLVTGSHDPTVVVELPASRSIVVDVSARRGGQLDGLDPRIERVKATIDDGGAECSAPSGSYRFEVRGPVGNVALELTGVGAAELVLERDGRVIHRAFLDVSAEEAMEIVL